MINASDLIDSNTNIDLLIKNNFIEKKIGY